METTAGKGNGMKERDRKVHDAERGPTRVRYSFEVRRRAVESMLGGMSGSAAAASAGADTRTAYRWLALYRADGWEGLRERPAAPGQRALVEAIARHRAERSYPPSIRELQQAAGFSSTSVVLSRLRECERAGLIVREAGLSRAITLTAAGRALAGLPPEREPAVADDGRPEGAA